MKYNVKFKQYLNTEIVTYYSKPIEDDSDRDNRKVVPTTGEICPSNRRVEWNPFEEDYIICSYMHDDDSSLYRSMRRTRQKVYDIAQANDWEYFMTFSFSSEHVDRYSYDAVVVKFSNWLKNMKRKCINLKYVVVPEQHKDGAWHFHGLFSNVDGLDFVDGGKRWCGRIIYNVGKYKYGWTTAIPTDSRPNVCTYLTKYITKDTCKCSRGRKRYWYSKNCNLPIEYKYFLEIGENSVDELRTAETYRKISKNAHQTVIYDTLPIYTTNTMRFNTSEEEFFPPHIDGIKEK